MATSISSDTTLQKPISITSKLSIPEFCIKTISSNIENFIEYSYVPEDAQIESFIPHLLSLYNVLEVKKGHLSGFEKGSSQHPDLV